MTIWNILTANYTTQVRQTVIVLKIEAIDVLFWRYGAIIHILQLDSHQHIDIWSMLQNFLQKCI